MIEFFLQRVAQAFAGALWGRGRRGATRSNRAHA